MSYGTAMQPCYILCKTNGKFITDNVVCCSNHTHRIFMKNTITYPKKLNVPMPINYH